MAKAFLGLMGLVAGVGLFFLICNIIEPLGVWLLDDHRNATLVVGCCLLVPVFVSLGVLFGGKYNEEKGKPSFTILSSIISSSLGFLICFIGVKLYEWFDYHHKVPSDVPDGSGLIMLLIFPLIIIGFAFAGAIVGYKRSDKRERNRIEQSETT